MPPRVGGAALSPQAKSFFRMTFQELKKDAVSLQRVLKVDGFYTGRIDGIAGPKTRAALARFEQELAALKQQMPLDERSEKNLECCALTLQRPVRKWMVERVYPYAAGRGIAVKIICGFRSDAEQNKLGASVTKARGGNSYHNYGAAVDLGMFKGGKYLENDAPYKALQAACGTPEGCLWGGTWKGIVDTPHYQLARWGSGIAALKAYLNK